MNWAKENPFLTGLIVVTLVVAGGLGYFAYSEYTTNTELLASYETEVGKLHQLQNRTPFPNAENLQKMNAARDEYQAALAQLAKSLRTKELPLNREVTPQQFQDELRKSVSNAQKQAAEAGMNLPKDFYLGFNTYSASLPSAEAAPHLARELKAIETLFAGFAEARVESLTQFERSALPIEEGGRANQNKNAPKQIEKNFLDLTFTGEQGRARLALNSLLNSPQFAIIRAIKVQNTAPLSPPIITEAASGTTTPTAPEFGANSAEPAKTAQSLNMVFGREKITIQVRLELLTFGTLPDTEANPKQ